jgi:hypothetical protein
MRGRGKVWRAEGGWKQKVDGRFDEAGENEKDEHRFRFSTRRITISPIPKDGTGSVYTYRISNGISILEVVDQINHALVSSFVRNRGGMGRWRWREKGKILMLLQGRGIFVMVIVATSTLACRHACQDLRCIECVSGW